MRHVLAIVAVVFLLTWPAAAQSQWGQGAPVTVVPPPSCVSGGCARVANTISPILSPEPATADPLAVYLGNSLVVGSMNTWTTSTPSDNYYNQITSNDTVVGTPTSHVGVLEITHNLLGTGTTGGEANVIKSYLYINSGVTVDALNDVVEASTANFGSMPLGGIGVTSSLTNQAGATVSNVWYANKASYGNQDPTAGSLTASACMTAKRTLGEGRTQTI